jgi:hypothetical protein
MFRTSNALQRRHRPGTVVIEVGRMKPMKTGATAVSLDVVQS